MNEKLKIERRLKQLRFKSAVSTLQERIEELEQMLNSKKPCNRVMCKKNLTLAKRLLKQLS